MKLKRLIVQGFKSFKDRTVIHFDEGITGIVGPNGCGKSNIVDALFWVMGEQSAKHLRGSSMKDVIFSGSSKYNPSAFAEVSLILGNEEGKHIHIGNKVSSPTEIQLTRKLYRNGETEYRINNNPCRLRDIQEVFMDTGAGAKSYSIIAQGEISRLVQAKPVERRAMIEEVAGITKFKVRKKESLRKIEQTQDNLNRLSDLQIEIEKNLRALQSQAEKAERARSLKSRIKRNDLVVQSHKEYEVLKSYQTDKNTLREKRLEVEAWSTRKNTLEVDLHEERLKRDEQTEEIEKYQKEFNELSKKLAASEERFNFLCQGLTEKEELVSSRKIEFEEVSNELVGRDEKLRVLNQQKIILEEQLSDGFDYSGLEEKFDSKKAELDENEVKLSETRSGMTDLSKNLNQVDHELFKNTSKLDEYSNNLQDITLEIESIEEQYSGFSGEMATERETVNILEKELKQINAEFSGLKNEILDLKDLNSKISNDVEEKNRELIRTESKLNSLIEINNSFEGVKEGNSNFLQTEAGSGFEIIGNLISSENEYTKAIEVLLGNVIDTLITNGKSLNNLSSWFNDNNQDTVDLLITSAASSLAGEETIERLKMKGLSNVVPLRNVVIGSDEYKSQLDCLLDGYFICENLDIESIDFREVQFRGITDRKGSIIVRKAGNGIVVQIKGTNSDSAGVVARNNTIIELGKNILPLSEKLNELEKQKDELRLKIEAKQDCFSELSISLQEKTTLHASKKSVMDSKLESFKSGNSRLEILKNRKKQISSSRFEIQELEEGLNNRQLKLTSSINEQTLLFDENNKTYLMLKEDCEILKEELIQRQIDAKTFEEKFKNNTTQIADIEEQIVRLKSRITNAEELIAKYEEEISGINSEVDELETSNQNNAKSLTERDEYLSLKKDDLIKLTSLMQERENEAKDLNHNINKNEKNIVELETKLSRYLEDEEQIVRNTFEKYHINLRKIICSFLEYTDDERSELIDISNLFTMETEDGPEEILELPYEFNRRYGQDLKECEVKYRQYNQELNRIGEINWQAIEEYDRQKLRYDFLRQQEVELKQSLEDLEKAISHIDEKSKLRFKTAFEEVSSRFQRVFPIIFGGGNALLKIIGDINDPECGVDIIAQPPGKKMQNINLMSGGEKALTALSLIFSIFLVKPSPFCLLDEVDAPLDDANVGRFNELLKEMSHNSQFILITHNKKTMELNDTLYGVTMQEPGVSKAISVQLH